MKYLLNFWNLNRLFVFFVKNYVFCYFFQDLRLNVKLIKKVNKVLDEEEDGYDFSFEWMGRLVVQLFDVIVIYCVVLFLYRLVVYSDIICFLCF